MDPGLSNLVISIAAGVTAVATVFIAVLTRGTVKLYHLEKTRRDAEGSRLAAVLGRFQAGAEGMLEVWTDEDEISWPNLDRVRERLTGWTRDIETAWRYAAELALPEVMANLHGAEVALRDLRDEMVRLDGIEHSDGPNSFQTVADMLAGPFPERLEHLTRYIEAANESLPAVMRDLRGRTYLEHLDVATARVLERPADEADDAT